MMKKSILLLFVLIPVLTFGRGLRHSVCHVVPEFSAQERSALHDMALDLSRSDMTNEARYIQVTTHASFYGSGVVMSGRTPCILTSRDVIGYARTATITVFLHDRTLRYSGCSVLGTDTVTGLVLIALPENKELDPLPLADMVMEDGDPVFSAGYTTLNKQATWQLVKGSVSNADLRREGCSYIQHTAPINVGMTGGPLLLKTDSGYLVVGLNIGKVGSRDEVAMAVSVEQIRRVLASDALLGGEQMVAQLRHRVETTTYSGKNRAAERERMARRETARGITSDIPRYRQNFFYHNYLSANNMETGIGLEFAMDKQCISFIGMQFAASWTEARPIAEEPTYTSINSGYYQLYDSRGVFTPLFGLYMGAQIPLRVGTKHVLVPRLSQGGNIGPCVNQYNEIENKRSVGAFMITSDSRLGLEYHYQLEKIDLILALEYTAHIYTTKAETCYRFKNNTCSPEPIDKNTQLIHYNPDNKNLLYTCLNHGLGVRFAVGF